MDHDRVVFLEGDDREMMAELDIACLFVKKFLPVPIEQATAEMAKYILLTKTVREIADEFINRVEKAKLEDRLPIDGYSAFLGLVAGVQLGLAFQDKNSQARKGLLLPGLRELAMRYFGQEGVSCCGQEAR